MKPENKLMLGWLIVTTTCAIIASVIWHVIEQYIYNDVLGIVLFVPYVLLVLFLEYRWYVAIFSPENLEDILRD